MTLIIDHIQLADGTWLAKAHMFPAWSFASAEHDKTGAQKSLKRYMARHVLFVHQGWDGNT